MTDQSERPGRYPEVVVSSHGGFAPEQWRGKVDGHSFYFRERHDHWHIEVDLHPSGASTAPGQAETWTTTPTTSRARAKKAK